MARSARGRGPRGLPVDGGDERLQADAADDLFKGGVVAVRRDEEGADCDLRGFFEIFAGQAAQTEASSGGGLKKQRADVRLLVALATQFDGIIGSRFRRRRAAAG